MKKIFLTMLAFSFSIFTVSAQSITGNGGNAKKDTFAVAEKAESTTTEYGHLQTVVCDSAKFNNLKFGYDNKAVKMPKYDAFSEKMKNDDWLGGLLKNILFR